MGRRKPQFETESVFPAGGQSDGHYLSRMGRKILPRVKHIAYPVGDGMDGLLQIEFPAVAGESVVPRKIKLQVAERLVGFLSQGHTHELPHGQFFRLFLPAVE